jgi:septum site-determining protein MinC
MTESCFQIKGSVVTVVVLELHHFSADQFAAQLEQKIQQAPQLLRQSPVVIDVERLNTGDSEVDFATLVKMCRDAGVQPIGFRDCARFQPALTQAGLALLPPTTSRGTAIRETAKAATATEPNRATEQNSTNGRRPSKIVTHPVRSGQQIYARDADLIITSQVSEGAEVLADGNIHIYGGLRGRALAGVGGDETARIFCQKLEAELLSVAGNFVLSEDIRERLWKEPAQAFLQDGTLCINPL